ncbi:MAG: ATP-binding cassette domain-containing protein, partial [Pseudomonadota bacterium]
SPLGIDCQRVRLPTHAKRFSFTIAPGQRVAVEGGDAASSLLRLIAGLGTPRAGRIDLESASGHKLRPNRTCGAAVLMAPDVPLRRGTLRGNLLCGSVGMSEERLFDVARRCDLWTEDENGIDMMETPIPEAGRGLSSSFAARLRLARAVLAEPGILLIDDPVTEIDGQVRRALQRVMEIEPMTLLMAVHSDPPPIDFEQWIKDAGGRLVWVPTIEATVHPFRPRVVS